MGIRKEVKRAQGMPREQAEEMLLAVAQREKVNILAAYGQSGRINFNRLCNILLEADRPNVETRRFRIQISLAVITIIVTIIIAVFLQS
jgi:IS4 transposase